MSDNDSMDVDEQKKPDEDKDLIIHSLNESLHIHKEILERIQNEKETYQKLIEKERQEEKESLSKWREKNQQILQEQNNHCQQLESSIAQLQQEIESKKEAYQKLEINFYSYVKQIRVTDDDLSTIQPEISHLLSQLNNTCMGLKSKIDRQGGTDFVFHFWPEKVDLIKKHMMPNSDLLDTSFITLFVEKYLIHTLLLNLMDIPIHLGVSINDAFKEIDEWMAIRNKEWANRLRQQLCALVVQQPGDEQDQIQDAKNNLLAEIVHALSPVYPTLEQDPRKIENLIQRASKLNLAVKGQEIKLECLPVQEGVTPFDPEVMKATAKGKPDGIVFLVITPTFIAKDELDDEHGFTVPGKVFCIEQQQESDETKSIIEEEHGKTKSINTEEKDKSKSIESQSINIEESDETKYNNISDEAKSIDLEEVKQDDEVKSMSMEELDDEEKNETESINLKDEKEGVNAVNVEEKEETKSVQEEIVSTEVQSEIESIKVETNETESTQDDIIEEVIESTQEEDTKKEENESTQEEDIKDVETESTQEDVTKEEETESTQEKNTKQVETESTQEKDIKETKLVQEESIQQVDENKTESIIIEDKNESLNEQNKSIQEKVEKMEL